jgi:hypothetical protein
MLRKSFALIAFVSVAICGSALAVDSKKIEVQVEATGTADIRDRAVVDACRLAVAKVHGSRVLGHMSNTDYGTFKIDAAGARNDEKASVWVEGGVYGVRDNSALSFDGHLLRWEIQNEQKQPDGRWAVKILATVLGTAPDRFEGREAVALTPLPVLVSQLKGKGASGDTVEEVARIFHRWLGEVFSNHPNFVILEREDESLANAELARSASARSAIKEKSKLGAEKTADITVEIRCEPLVVETQVIPFNSAPSLNKAKMSLQGTIRMIDVSTKGEIGRVPFKVENPKPTNAPGSLELAVKKAVSEFEKELKGALRPLKFDLFSKLGVVNIVFGENGVWSLAGGLANDEDFLRQGDRVSLWLGEGSNATKVGESLISLDAGRFAFVDTSLKFGRGEAFSVRLSKAAEILERKALVEKVSAATEPSEAPKKSLKERLKFD